MLGPGVSGGLVHATRAAGFKDDSLSTSSQDSLGTLFLSEAVTASALLHEHRAQARERAVERETGTTLTLRQ